MALPEVAEVPPEVPPQHPSVFYRVFYAIFARFFFPRSVVLGVDALAGGDSPAGYGGLGFRNSQNFVCLRTSSRLVVGPRLCAVFVRIFRHGLIVEFRLCSLVSFGRWMSIWLARSKSIGGVFSAVFGRAVTRKPPPLGVRCLFSEFVA